jgi:protein-S-isoprenylcysteine O-methyltransferase Ste14
MPGESDIVCCLGCGRKKCGLAVPPIFGLPAIPADDRLEDLMTNETLFHIGFWVLVGGVLAMRAYFSMRVRRSGGRITPDRQAVEREGSAMFLTRVIGFFVLLAALVLYGIDSPWMRPLSIPLPGWLRAAGFFLALISLLFEIWAQTVLDREWSPQLQLQTDHRLVTAGPYARMRHPIYTALVGWAVGFALVTANWIFAAFALLAPMVFFLRVPREEKMMLDTFGEEYRKYMERTGRFLPRF